MSNSDATTASNGFEPDVEDEDYESVDYDPEEELDGDDDLGYDEEDEQ
jgi:hypothetical protein